MSRLTVLDVFHPGDGSTILVLRADDAPLRVGTAVQGAHGQVPVRSLETITGPALELPAGATGRVTLDGELAGVQAGDVLTTVDPTPFSAAPPPYGAPPPPPYGAPPPAGYPAPPPYGYATPPPPYGAPVPAPGPALPVVQVEQPDRLSRLSTAFRLVLLVPQAIVLSALGLAAGVVVFIGWFAALFTGRLPAWAFDFLAGWLRWSGRVGGYAMLLTDRYPPFDLAARPDDRVRVQVVPTMLNRAAVFFRLVLIFPVYLLTELLWIGWIVFSPVIWVTVLVTGRYPPTMFQASAATLRFWLRTTAYTYLLTSAYPAELFGDRPMYGAAPDRPLVLSGGAKALVSLFIALGVLGWVANVAASLAGGGFARLAAEIQLAAAHQRVSGTLQTLPNQLLSCGSDVTCVAAADDSAAVEVDRFGSDLDGISFPGSDRAQVSALHQASDSLAGALHAHQSAQVVEPLVTQVDAAYTSLMNALAGGS